VIAAAHEDLATLADAGTFRHDLYYRINVIELRVPPLRERGDDLPQLATDILARLAHEQDRSAPTLANDAMAALMDYPFPGNVRELENILERAVALCEDGTISAEDMRLIARNPSSQRPPEPEPMHAAPARPPTGTAAAAESPGIVLPDSAYSGDLAATVAETERAVITKALEATRWNRTAAAKQLGLTLRQLRYRLEKLGIE
jgi:two-component system response regulator PilR (NtrC family)